MSPNLITLDTSFDLEDFDPLNSNAKMLPSIQQQRPPSQVAHDLASTMFAASASRPTPTNNAHQPISNYHHYNPVYPMNQGGMAAAPPQALPRRIEIDAETDLLRQYGLLSLLDVSSSAMAQQANGSAAPPSSRKDWTDFD